jgi:uncharacterized protein YggT (Ycf19 family)
MRSDLLDSLGRPARPRNLSRAYLLGRIALVFDYLFGLLYTLFVVRLALEFFRARPGAGFVQFIRSVTEPFYAPFRGIFATSSVDGGYVVWPLVVALLAYMLLHAAIRGLLGLLARG